MIFKSMNPSSGCYGATGHNTAKQLKYITTVQITESDIDSKNVKSIKSTKFGIFANFKGVNAMVNSNFSNHSTCYACVICYCWSVSY